MMVEQKGTQLKHAGRGLNEELQNWAFHMSQLHTLTPDKSHHVVLVKLTGMCLQK